MALVRSAVAFEGIGPGICQLFVPVAFAVLKDITPFEPTIILLYTLPKKQKLNGRLITPDHTSSVFALTTVPTVKPNGGAYGIEFTVYEVVAAALNAEAVRDVHVWPQGIVTLDAVVTAGQPGWAYNDENPTHTATRMTTRKMFFIGRILIELKHENKNSFHF